MHSTTTNITHPQTSAGSPLGTTAKSSTPPLDLHAARAEKYLALSQAKKWIAGKAKQLRPDLAYPGDFMRTHDCRYVRTESKVNIRQGSGASYYSGLATCGSVWACPVCAQKIQEKRRQELDHLVDSAQAHGLQCIMVTLTFPHQSFHSLSDLIGKQREAFKRFRTGSPFSRLKDSIGFYGMVRSLEVTYGQNGWHPHTHELWIVKEVSGDLLPRISELWRRACAAVGLLDLSDPLAVHAFGLRAVDIRENCSSADYLAKQDSSRAWGITHEVAKAKSKAGRAKGVHPHEFLVRAAPGDCDRYFEYIEAMKGSRQLFWSPGLKLRCGLPEVQDIEAAEKSDELDVSLGSLTPDEWDFIRSNNLRAQVLDVSEIAGFDSVSDYLLHKGYVPSVIPDYPPFDPSDPWLILPFSRPDLIPY